MGIFDSVPTGKAIRHRVALVDGFSDMLDFQFDLGDPVCQEINCIHTAPTVFWLDGRSVGGEPVWVLEIFGQHRLQLFHGFFMVLNEFRQLFDVSGNGSSRQVARLCAFIRQPQNPLVRS